MPWVVTSIESTASHLNRRIDRFHVVTQPHILEVMLGITCSSPNSSYWHCPLLYDSTMAPIPGHICICELE
jgi:hypothetical protein